MQANRNRNNKKKIINDPIYGFISIPDEFIFDVIEHPYMQRLRRISQLGLSHLVYPGAVHTRFQHVVGAMHLMGKAINVLKNKGCEISDDEKRAVLLAILLHDIGHGPFSHALEFDIVKSVTHEDISAYFIQSLEQSFGSDLNLALKIFEDKHEKPFLHQLVSSQLDMDRLDYLNRDSFFSGVSEGIIGSDRLIEMLAVHKGQLVLEEKGIYSVEKFIVARRLMYWQVYLHKTVVAAEYMLIYALRRAKWLARKGVDVFSSPALSFFLNKDLSKQEFENDKSVLENFASLDDYDILQSLKVWSNHTDATLKFLSSSIVNRKLFKIEIAKEPFSHKSITSVKNKLLSTGAFSEMDLSYLVFSDKLVNKAYNQKFQNINLLMKTGEIVDLSEASDNLNISALARPVEKYFLCYPR
ncbi:MAG: HD domain-containing protein [Crocinitomicaceae bacterium]|nr:HD domain-containing protein [Crocinitomicaceae bacterium]